MLVSLQMWIGRVDSLTRCNCINWWRCIAFPLAEHATSLHEIIYSSLLLFDRNDLHIPTLRYIGATNLWFSVIISWRLSRVRTNYIGIYIFLFQLLHVQKIFTKTNESIMKKKIIMWGTKSEIATGTSRHPDEDVVTQIIRLCFRNNSKPLRVTNK